MTYPLEILHEEELGQDPKGDIVFVHGICHDTRCWKNFIDFFSAQGYRCSALSLRGHGGSGGRKHFRLFTLANYVEDVEQAVAQCDTKPFLIGHSMGGAVVQQYIGKHADSVRGAVLFAPATASKMNRRKTFVSLLRHPDMLKAAYVSWGCKSPENVQGAAFFTSVGEDGRRSQRIEDPAPYMALLQSESLRITFSQLYKKYTKNHQVSIPIFVIGSYTDAYFPEKSLVSTAAAYKGNGKTALMILRNLCHDMMLDPDWEESAKPVLEFIEDPEKFVNDPKHHWPRASV